MADQRTALTVGGNVSSIVPQNIEEAFRLAGAFSASGIAPSTLNSPEKVMVAILAGAELGLPPFQAMQSFAVINGRATLWGDGMLAVVRAQGVRVREWIKGEGDEMVAWCEAIRPDGEVTERCFSVADAKKANLWGKAGPWQQYPKRMLGMRARAFSLRDGCADILRGMQMYEEVEDYTEIRDVTPRKAKANLRDKLAAPTDEASEGFNHAKLTEELDRHDPKTGEVVEGRPTETAGSQTAETELDTPASATDASTASQEETSGPKARDDKSSGGASPEADAIERNSGSGGDDNFPGDVDTETSREPVKPQVETKVDNSAFGVFWRNAPEGADWATVKKALAGVYGSDDWKALEPEDQSAFRSKVWTVRGDGKVDFAADPSAFRCWMATQKGPDGADAIEGSFRVLEKEATYQRMRDDQKATLANAVKAACAILRGE